MAAYKGHIEAFEALLELTASIDDVDEDNKTAVHLAAEQNHPDLLDVRILELVLQILHIFMDSCIHCMKIYFVVENIENP